MGSCFAENMGKRLDDLSLTLLNQPFGTQFNPTRILNALAFETTRASDVYTEGDFYLHPDFHSDFISQNPEDLLAEIRVKQEETKAFLNQADTLILTFGTAYFYHDNILNRPIANCHKQASQRFEKHMNQVSEITQAYRTFIKSHPHLHLILTVSPVRHTRDGMMENSVSKATLRLAANEIAQEFPDQVTYFPAFEIMMDELRDYRFYEKDLIHPNEMAVDYIWQKFKETYFSNELVVVDVAWERIIATLHHRPHPTKKHLHIANLEKIKGELASQFPEVDYSKLTEKLAAEILSLKASLGS
ncbi:MAG: GSCFA family protein [Cytophagia bacterium]|nr:GSCFA family protein [Cytophagia bacterium]